MSTGDLTSGFHVLLPTRAQPAVLPDGRADRGHHPDSAAVPDQRRERRRRVHRRRPWLVHLRDAGPRPGLRPAGRHQPWSGHTGCRRKQASAWNGRSSWARGAGSGLSSPFGPAARVRGHPYVRLALDPRFAAYWLAQTISLFGDRLHQVALGVLVLQRHGLASRDGPRLPRRDAAEHRARAHRRHVR